MHTNASHKSFAAEELVTLQPQKLHHHARLWQGFLLLLAPIALGATGLRFLWLTIMEHAPVLELGV